MSRLPPSPDPSPPSLLRRHRHVVELPEHDPLIEALPSGLRQEVADTWERRAHEELKVAAAFSVLTRELLEVGADRSVLAAVSRAVNDEVRHAEVCRCLASKYRGTDVSWPAEVVVEPSSRGDERRLRTTFHVVVLCCVNEAIATTFLAASLDGARSPSARAAVGELLGDEVEHARVGWTYLATQPRPTLAAVEANLLTLVEPVWRTWWGADRVTLVHGAPEHGIPAVTTMRGCVAEALREIVAPGFAQLGLDVGPLSSWVAERAGDARG